MSPAAESFQMHTLTPTLTSASGISTNRLSYKIQFKIGLMTYKFTKNMGSQYTLIKYSMHIYISQDARTSKPWEIVFDTRKYRSRETVQRSGDFHIKRCQLSKGPNNVSKENTI